MAQPEMRDRPDVNFLDPDDPICQPFSAAQLVGQASMSDERVREETGAEFVRQLGPDDPPTNDLRYDRATIINDPQSGRIRVANCS